jgi:hypothetical protein
LLVNEAIVESGWANLFLRFKGRWLEKAKKPFAQEKGGFEFLVSQLNCVALFKGPLQRRGCKRL